MQSPSAILKKHEIWAKKRLGQHFLIATPTIEKIISACDIKPEDTVIEIGPGIGILTAFAAQKARRIFAVEKDRSLANIAKTEFGEIENIEWIEGDILKLSIEKIIGNSLPFVRGGLGRGRSTSPDPSLQRRGDVSEKIKIIGNLPYNISSPIMFWMLEHKKLISSATIMLQKEVAERIAAGPGSKDYGILSVLIGAFAKAKKLFDISPQNFIPPPKVWSSIVRLEFDHGPSKILDEKTFFKVVKASFGKRRKMLKNSLASLKDLAPEFLEEVLKKADISLKARAEDLAIEKFIFISNEISRIFRCCGRL